MVWRCKGVVVWRMQLHNYTCSFFHVLHGAFSLHLLFYIFDVQPQVHVLQRCSEMHLRCKGVEKISVAVQPKESSVKNGVFTLRCKGMGKW